MKKLLEELFALYYQDVYRYLYSLSHDGSLRVNIENEDVSPEKAAEILLEIRRLMDGAGVPFHCVDLTLEYPSPENGMDPRPEGSVEIAVFPYEDIYEENLAERVRNADQREED